jgi:hypothetical protein
VPKKKKGPPLSAKSLAGGGVDFEHAVAAWFIACLLTDTPPLAETFGRLTRIEFQTGDAFRPLDDLLLHLENGGKKRGCALSVRSNKQITRSGMPDDFVLAAWRLSLEPGATGFRLEHDLAGLITARLASGVEDALHTLLRAAAAQDVDRSVPTAKGKIQTALLESFECPEELAARYKPPKETLRRVLRSVVHKDFDFERQNSVSLKQGINLCRSALISGEAVQAELLWSELCGIATRLSPNEGSLTRAGLLDRLRGTFALRASPHFEPDWERLRNLTSEELATIRDAIGDEVRLPRERELTELSTPDVRFVALHGEPGVGKTVVAKWWAEKQMNTARVWWLNAGALDVVSFTAFAGTFGLQNSLADLLASTPDARAWLVVDGLDASYDSRVFRHFAQLLHALPQCWRVLVTCQTEHWERIRDLLEKANATVDWILFEVFTPAILEGVLAQFKNLEPLLRRPRLRPLITRPRYLDSLTRHFNPRNFKRDWVGESDFLNWFWGTEIETPPHGSSQSEVAKKLATRVGDALRADIAAEEFSASEHEHLDVLIANNICRKRNERISFTHDRVGDWARQRVLVGRVDELARLLSNRVDSPPWMIALRLLGVQLLEQDADLDRWRRLLSELGELPNGERAQDALLEAATFAEQNDLTLEKIWPDLIAEKGRLLIRLLRRFRHLGSLPHPVVNRLPAEQRVHLQELRYRVPIAHQWPTLLRTLYAHHNEVVEFAPSAAAKLAACWLENGPATGEARREAAQIALSVGKRALEWTRQQNFYLERKSGVPLFRAALLAASELPDEAALFARDATYRLPLQLSTRHYVEVNVKLGAGSYKGFYPPPWKDGPSQPLSEDFQRAVLDGNTLVPLMAARPEAAKEVLLAAVIAPPREPDPHLEHNTYLLNQLSLDEGSDYSLPNPFRGPFLSLLHQNADATIEAIVRLTNFAAERWKETPRAQHAAPREVIVRFGDDERTLIGDYHVFLWYRFEHGCPHVLSAALMALDFWFTERIAVGTGHESAAEKLLEETNNVAIAGLLCAVGCQKPDLFTNVLSPLVTAPEFHDWEMGRRIAPKIGSLLSDLPQQKLLDRWSEQPHRARGLDEIAFDLFRRNESFRDFMEPVATRWEQRASGDASPRFKFLVEQMAPRFRRSNYREVGSDKPLEYVPPQALIERNAERQRKSDDFYLPHEFPLRCRALLNAGKPMLNEHLEDFWQTLQRVDNLGEIAEDASGVMRKETSYCAAAAVLLIYHRNWFTSHPDRERWLLEKLIGCVLQPPAAALLDDDRDIWGFDWSAYAALAVAALWEESPTDPAYRRLVAQLAIYRKYKTVELLCGGVAARRGELGEHFAELLNFVCDWAVEKERAEGARYGENAYDPAPWLQREIEGFCNRVRPRKKVPWKNLSVELEPTLPWRPNSARPMRYTFDIELWQKAFAWVPSLRRVAGSSEREWLLEFWRYHLQLALSRLNAEPRDQHSRGCIPYQTEQWLLESVARVVLDLSEPAERAALWQPIFASAPDGAHWIEVFAGALLVAAGEIAARGSAFKDIWPTITDWALNSSGWNYSARTAFILASAWRTLLGLDNAEQFLELNHDQLASWIPLYGRWASDWLSERSCAVMFCRFLQLPPTAALLPHGLAWLNKHVLAGSLRYQRDVSNAVSELLVILADTRQNEIVDSQPALQSYRALLSSLTAIQHPRAVEVETLLSSRGGL